MNPICFSAGSFPATAVSNPVGLYSYGQVMRANEGPWIRKEKAAADKPGR